VPEDDPIVATVVVLLIHVPPVVASLSVLHSPAQTVVGPVIPTGTGFTVPILNVLHKPPVA
jgi:hypothetical protein